MEIYIDAYGLKRPAIKCNKCGRIMEYVGYDDEPYSGYAHRCSGCNCHRHVEENYYEYLWNILNQSIA